MKSRIVCLDLPLLEACDSKVNHTLCALLRIQHSGRAQVSSI